MQDELHPVASARFWTNWMAQHDVRRGVPFVTDHLVGTAVLDIDDDRSLEDLQQLAQDRGIDGMLQTVDLIIVDRVSDGSPIAQRIVDVDLAHPRAAQRVHSPGSFQHWQGYVRGADDQRAAAQALLS